MKSNLKAAALIAVLAVFSAIPASAQLLWKVSGHGAKGDSYLFGTHHVAPVSMIDSVKGLRDAITSSDRTYGEVDMSQMNSPEFQARMVTCLQAPADSTLSRLLTPAQLDSVNVILRDLSGGMADVSMLESLKPSVVNMQMVLLENIRQFPGFNPQQQLDATVQQIALQAGKPVSGLETVEDQVRIIYGKPLPEQAGDLMECVRDFKKEAENVKALTDAYNAQDLAAMERLFNEETKGDPVKMEELLYDRNDKWVAQLLEVIPRESVLVCVGAGHLIGEKGLIEQLRKAGYEVTPVK